jgi:hypothetical protein
MKPCSDMLFNKSVLLDLIILIGNIMAGLRFERQAVSYHSNMDCELPPIWDGLNFINKTYLVMIISYSNWFIIVNDGLFETHTAIQHSELSFHRLLYLYNQKDGIGNNPNAGFVRLIKKAIRKFSMLCCKY